MYCVKCGAKLDDGAKFCQSCGEKVTDETGADVKVVPKIASSLNVEAIKVAAKKKLSKKAIAAVVAVLVVLLLVIGFTTHKNKTVCVSDYATVNFSGYDTYGEAEIIFNEDAFLADFADKAGKLKQNAELEAWFGDDGYHTVLYDINYGLDQYENLSNEDSVHLAWAVDTESIKNGYGIKVVAREQNYKVSGLTELIPFDPFEAVDIHFEGIDGEGELCCELKLEDEIYDDLYFTAENNDDLSNGDTVTVTLQADYLYNSEEDVKAYCARKYGKIPTTFSKDYTVSGLYHYITSPEEMTASVIDKAKAANKTHFDSDFENTTTVLKKLDYLGYYTLFPIDKSGYYNFNTFGKNNSVCYIYKATAEFNKDGESEEIEYYTFIRYLDLCVNDQGEVGWSRGYFPSSTIKASFADWGKPYVFGYSTLDELLETFDSYDYADYSCEKHLIAASNT